MSKDVPPVGTGTIPEMLAARKATEREAASLLGELLIEFGRLEMNQGLALVWMRGGSALNSLTNKAARMGFAQRLALMSELLEEPDDALSAEARVQRQAEFSLWIERAHEIRHVRNRFAHGRWGVEAYGREIYHVIGLPTSPEQSEVAYSLAQFRGFIETMRELRLDLEKLCRRWLSL